MPTSSTAEPPPDLIDSPLYLLAVLIAARRAGDKALERVTRRRLATLGVHIAYADELTPPARQKGAGDA